jgi:hypothetical protein
MQTIDVAATLPWMRECCFINTQNLSSRRFPDVACAIPRLRPCSRILYAPRPKSGPAGGRVHFAVGIHLARGSLTGEGKETCPETRIEMINMQKIMFVQGLDQLANRMFREGKEMVPERPPENHIETETYIRSALDEDEI